jgi:hypothetical protein
MNNPDALRELQDNIKREITNSSKTTALLCVEKYFQKVRTRPAYKQEARMWRGFYEVGQVISQGEKQTL